MFCKPGDTVRFLAFAQVAASGLGKAGITVTLAVNEGTTNKVTAASATAMTAVDATNQPGLYYYDYTVTSTFFGPVVAQATTTDTTCIVRSLEMLFQSVPWLLTCASGTASAGAAGSITLAGASSTDSLYNGETVQIIAGTGAGQARTITGYVGSTKVATVGRNWAVTPDSTSVFSVIPGAHPRVDDNLAVVVQSGTGTGQISLSSGAVTVGTNNDKTGYALTQTFPANFSSLGISAGGKIAGVVLADTLTAYTGNTPQTGDSFARIGSAGAGLTALGDTRIANLDATVSSRSTYAGGAVASVSAAVTLPAIPANWITAGGIAASALNGKGDWMASYAQPAGFLGLDFGTLALRSQIPANFTAGTFSAAGVFATAALANSPTGGGGGLDAAGTRAALGMSAANLDTQLAAIKSGEDAIKAKTDNLPANPAATGAAMTLTTAYDAAKTANATAPDNASITAIKAKTDNLPAAPCAVSDIPSAAAIAAAVWSATARTLSAFGFPVNAGQWGGTDVGGMPNATAPDNASVAATKAVTDKLSTMLETAGAAWRYTVASLHNAPAGGGGGGEDPWKTDGLGSYAAHTAGAIMHKLDTVAPVSVIPGPPPPPGSGRVYAYTAPWAGGPQAGIALRIDATTYPSVSGDIVRQSAPVIFHTDADGLAAVVLPFTSSISPPGTVYVLNCPELGWRELRFGLTEADVDAGGNFNLAALI